MMKLRSLLAGIGIGILLISFQNCGAGLSSQVNFQDGQAFDRASLEMPTATPLQTPIISPTPIATATPEPTPIQTATPDGTPKPTATASSTATPAPAATSCAQKPAHAFYAGFPKLQYTSASLNRAINCARADLVANLREAASDLYTYSRLETGAVKDRTAFFAAPTLGDFHKLATGASAVKNSFELSGARPGDARIALRLSAAAFFESEATASAYRTHVRELLLRWSSQTLRGNEPSADLGEIGLTLGSSISAFASGYDLLVSGGGMPNAAERKQVEDWFRRAIPLIVKSNDDWFVQCRAGTPFAYDGQSCERARGDNHVSVGASALYSLAVLTDDKVHQELALGNGALHGWGIRDRIPTIIYRSGDTVAKQDRFEKVHTGEIYDRWRGHWNERGRALQLHRSIAYPYLNLSALLNQALVAKARGIDLSAPVTRKDGKPISIANAVRFYAELIKNYSPRDGIGGKPSEFFTTEDNYSKQIYCVQGISESAERPTVKAGGEDFCPIETESVKLDHYFFAALAAGKALYTTSEDPALAAALDKVVSVQKMSTIMNTPFGHVLPYEPALLVQAAE